MEYKIKTHTPKIKLYPKKFITVKGEKILCPYGYTEDQILKICKNNDYIKIFNLDKKSLYKLPTNKIDIYQNKDTNVYAFPILVAPRIFNTKILTENDSFYIPDDVVQDNINNKCLIIIDNVFEHTFPIKKTKNDTCRIFYNVLENTISKYNLNTKSMLLNVNNYNPPNAFEIDTVTCNLAFGVEFYDCDMEKYNENLKFLHNPKHRPFKLVATNSRPRTHRCDFAEFVYKNNLQEENIISFNTSKEQVDIFNPENNYTFKNTLPWHNKIENPNGEEQSLGTLWNHFIDYKLYNKAYCEFIYDTEFVPQERGVIITEKLNKPIKHLNPFVIAGTSGTLDVLKSLGFKTFDKWWDESYDTEYDPDIKTEKLNNLFLELSSWSHDKWCNTLDEMGTILTQNYYNYYRIHTKVEYLKSLEKYIDDFVAKNDK